MDEQPKLRTIGASAATVAILVAMVAGIAAYSNKEKTDPAIADTATQTPAATSTAQPAVATTSTPAASSTTYADGTYTAAGAYSSPGGRDSINVTLAIKEDTVTASTVTSGTISGESQEYVDRFIAGYKVQVIGKKLDSISLGRVSGSSLTPQGFNAALASIKAQAKA